MESIKALLAELYTAYFDRAPDAAGLAYWEEQMNSGAMDYASIAQNWANEQPEFVEVYGTNPDTTTLINKVYENVLGRTPDSDGAAYWSGELDNGNISADLFIGAVVSGAKAPTGSPTDAKLLQNKAAVGVSVADAGINDLTFAKKAVKAVSADVSTVSIVTGLVNIVKTDATALDEAVGTLNAVHTMLLDAAAAPTLTQTLQNLKTAIVLVVAEVSAGAVANVASVVQATTATVQAATQDSTFIADPTTLAGNIVSDPVTVQTDAEAVTQPAPAPTPAPAPDTTPPTATLTYSKDGGTTWTTTADVKDADTLIIKATFSEAVADATGATIAIDNSVLSATAMTKVSSTVYTYSLDVPAGDIASAAVTIGAAADAAGNVINAASANDTFTIDNTAPTITSVAIPNAPMKVGDTVTATIAADEAGLTLGIGAIDLFPLSNLTDNGGGNYTATFTVTDGGTDIVANSSIPVSIQMVDSAGNWSAAYTTAISQANDAIDANVPTVIKTPFINNSGGISLLVDEDATAGIYTSNSTLVGNEVSLTANTEGTIAVNAQTSVTSGSIIITDAAANQTTSKGVLLGTTGNDSINATDTGDIIIGFDGDDTLTGGSGNDNISGGSGVDTINGGAGDDVLLIDDSDTSIIGGDGTDTVQINADTDVSGITFNTVETITALTDGADFTVSAAQVTSANPLFFGTVNGDGTNVDEQLIVLGTAGDDTIQVGMIAFNHAGATIYGYGGNDTISSQDSIVDTIDAGAGNDRIDESEDIDNVDGGDGTDTIVYDLGDVSAANLEDADLVNVENIEIVYPGSNSYDFSAQSEGFNITDYQGGNTIIGAIGNDTINGNLGNDIIDGYTGDDTIDGGGNDDIIRGGAGVDTMTGGAGDDTFVVLGTIGANDYAVSEVTNTTGAYALGLATLIDTGLLTSDSGTDGSGETYNGGDGTNVIEIWGNADLTNATVANISSFNTHSDLTISATQLQTLFTQNGNAAIALNLMDDASIINITGVTQDIGLSLLNYFSTGLDSTNTTLLNGAPTIAFDMDVLSAGSNTHYTIKPEDMFDISGLHTNILTDASGDNSVMAASGYTNNTTDVTTVNAGDGNDIVVVGAMNNQVTVNGGAGDDILVFADTNGATTDLDNVTNVEIIALTGGAAAITTVDGLVDNTVQQNGLAVNAADLTGALTFNGSAETDGYFRISGSSYADTIIGGNGSDYVTADDLDTIDLGANRDNDGTGPQTNGDVVTFDAAVSATNLIDTDLVNVETVVITDIGADGSEVYDFSAQTEALSILINQGTDNHGVTLKGGGGDDHIINNVSGGTNIIDGGTGNDTITSTAIGSATITGGTGTDIIGNGDIDNNGAYTYQYFTTLLDGASVNQGADKLLFYDSDLTGLTGFVDASASGGTLLTLNSGAKVEFVSSGTPSASGAYAVFLFNTSNGQLTFDADGTGANAAIVVGTLYSDASTTAITDLTAGDFTFLA